VVAAGIPGVLDQRRSALPDPRTRAPAVMYSNAFRLETYDHVCGALPFGECEGTSSCVWLLAVTSSQPKMGQS